MGTACLIHDDGQSDRIKNRIYIYTVFILMAMQVLPSAWSSPGQLTGLIIYYEICLLLLITQVFESGFIDHYSEAEEARKVGGLYESPFEW